MYVKREKSEMEAEAADIAKLVGLKAMGPFIYRMLLAEDEVKILNDNVDILIKKVAGN